MMEEFEQMSLTEASFEPYRIKNKIRLIELFGGIGVQAGIYGNKCIADNLISPTFKQFKKESEEYFESHKGMAKGETK
jgi:hypothetical protein